MNIYRIELTGGEGVWYVEAATPKAASPKFSIPSTTSKSAGTQASKSPPSPKTPPSPPTKPPTLTSLECNNVHLLNHPLNRPLPRLHRVPHLRRLHAPTLPSDQDPDYYPTYLNDPLDPRD